MSDKEGLLRDVRIRAQSSALLIIDIQERLLPAIAVADADRLVRNAKLLIDAAALFDVPVLVSEQYPRGLGPTIGPIAQSIEDGRAIAKTEFSCFQNDALRGAIDAAGKTQIVLCGIEAHVCVLQTALDLAPHYEVHVAADGIGSRDTANKAVGLEQMRQGGAIITSAETVAFQWCGKAGSDQFKALSRLVR